MPPIVLSFLLFFANASDPFATPARARVLVFARTDCPITNRYAPELGRIAQEFADGGVKFWIVYPDPAETAEKMARHMAEYHLPGEAVKDRDGSLRKRADAKVSPQAAVFDSAGKLVYSGRIDDRFVALGQSRPAPNVHNLEDAIRDTLAGKAIVPARTKAIGCYLSDLQ